MGVQKYDELYHCPNDGTRFSFQRAYSQFLQTVNKPINHHFFKKTFYFLDSTGGCGTDTRVSGWSAVFEKSNIPQISL